MSDIETMVRPLTVPPHKRRAVAKAVHRATRAAIHQANGIDPAQNLPVAKDDFVSALMDACNDPDDNLGGDLGTDWPDLDDDSGDDA